MNINKTEFTAEEIEILNNAKFMAQIFQTTKKRNGRYVVVYQNYSCSEQRITSYNVEIHKNGKLIGHVSMYEYFNRQEAIEVAEFWRAQSR